ncbi:hypothetical protein [Bacteroides sp.]
MKQIKNIIFCLPFLMSIGFLTGCDSVLGDDDNMVKGGETMEMGFTRSSESASPSAGFLIFWKQNLNDFFTASVEDLKAYKAEKYNTGEAYPEDNTTVHATGFSPLHMQLSEDYQTLTLPLDAKPGETDVCVATEKINGSYTAPFSQTMTFEHTLTKVTFYAQRDRTMEGFRNVGNIQITIPAESRYLPIQWKWDETAGKYKVGSSTANTDLILSHPGILFEMETEEVGTAYLMLPANNYGLLKNINITADITRIGEIEAENQINETPEKIQLHDENGNEIVNAKAGEAYTIEIVFQQNSFTLIARQQDDWEKGGLIYVPVKP